MTRQTQRIPTCTTARPTAVLSRKRATKKAIDVGNIICLPELPDQKTLFNYAKPPLTKFEIIKPHYPREWDKYIQARQNERPLAIQLLAESLDILNVKTYGKRNGRPPFPLRDKLFLCIQKALRGTTYDANKEYIEYANLKGYVTYAPSPHSVADFMNDSQLTPLLERLLVLTATPLADIERRFSIDATGLGTPFKDRWVQVLLEKKQHKDYKKLHALVGTSTNIIVAAKITVGTSGDSPQLIPLLDIAREYFTITELSGDAAYASRNNATAVVENGGTPFFKLKKNITGRAKGSLAWSKMVRHFTLHRGNYERHYHLRSNVESTFAMLKRKVKGSLSSKNPIAQTNEALCLAVAHNLFCLVTALYCRGLEPKFKK